VFPSPYDKLFVLSGEVICYFFIYVCLFSIVRFEVSWDSGRDDDVIEFLTTKQDLPCFQPSTDSIFSNWTKRFNVTNK
jgi:hypothetical protein